MTSLRFGGPVPAPPGSSLPPKPYGPTCLILSGSLKDRRRQPTTCWQGKGSGTDMGSGQDAPVAGGRAGRDTSCWEPLVCSGGPGPPSCEQQLVGTMRLPEEAKASAKGRLSLEAAKTPSGAGPCNQRALPALPAASPSPEDGGDGSVHHRGRRLQRAAEGLAGHVAEPGGQDCPHWTGGSPPQAQQGSQTRVEFALSRLPGICCSWSGDGSEAVRCGADAAAFPPSCG
ncbi:Growth/Differentiation Factor 9 [Manis pentadactyla]|nr:Growth/Differentiation Factor 9 [Manis pentadactyla]